MAGVMVRSGKEKVTLVIGLTINTRRVDAVVDSG